MLRCTRVLAQSSVVSLPQPHLLGTKALFTTHSLSFAPLFLSLSHTHIRTCTQTHRGLFGEQVDLVTCDLSLSLTHMLTKASTTTSSTRLWCDTRCCLLSLLNFQRLSFLTRRQVSTTRGKQEDRIFFIYRVFCRSPSLDKWVQLVLLCLYSGFYLVPVAGWE